MVSYRRSHAVAMGRLLDHQDRLAGRVHRDAGGQVLPFDQGGPPTPPQPAAPPPGYAQYAASPSFSAPFLGMQVPNYRGPGGYSSPLTANTPPAQAMMAMQQHADGGPIYDAAAYHHANSLLEHAKRACGGSVNRPEEFAKGGAVPSRQALQLVKKIRLPREILALWNRIDRENPSVSADRRFSYVCARIPEVANLFRGALKDGYSRSGAHAMIHGGLRILANSGHYD